MTRLDDWQIEAIVDGVQENVWLSFIEEHPGVGGQEAIDNIHEALSRCNLQEILEGLDL